MGMYPAVNICYGWAIRSAGGDFVNDVVDDTFRQTKDEWEDGFASWCDAKLYDTGIEAEAVSFGFEHRGVALAAKQTVKTFYSWESDYTKAPVVDRWNTSELDAELQDVLDLFDMYEARLGAPGWLMLVSYG